MFGLRRTRLRGFSRPTLCVLCDPEPRLEPFRASLPSLWADTGSPRWSPASSGTGVSYPSMSTNLFAGMALSDGWADSGLSGLFPSGRHCPLPTGLESIKSDLSAWFYRRLLSATLARMLDYPTPRPVRPDPSSSSKGIGPRPQPPGSLFLRWGAPGGSDRPSASTAISYRNRVSGLYLIGSGFQGPKPWLWTGITSASPGPDSTGFRLSQCRPKPGSAFASYANQSYVFNDFPLTTSYACYQSSLGWN